MKQFCFVLFLVCCCVLFDVYLYHHKECFRAFDEGQIKHTARVENDISIVVPTRIDDYGGDATGRFYRMLLNTSQSFPKSEIIVVDWGSDDDGVLDLNKFVSKHDLRNTIVYHIGKNITEKYPFFMEYVAKNIGIRRATRHWVLTINQDALFTPQTTKMLRFGDLSEYVFYRTERIEESDVFTYKFKKRDGLCYQHCSVDEPMKPFDVYTHYKKCRSKHMRAPGDFIMATKVNWMRAAGFQEAIKNRNEVAIDTIMGYKFNFYQVAEQFLLEPCMILHQTHKSGRRYRQKAYRNEDIYHVHDCVKSFVVNDTMQGPCFRLNPTTWGFSNIEFDNFTVT